MTRICYIIKREVIGMKKIAILADSGCQLPIDQLENQGIFIAPLTITIGEKSYLDQIDIDSLTVFEKMDKENVMVKMVLVLS